MAGQGTKPPPSAAIYIPILLPIYDAFVLSFSNAFAWRCSTKNVLLPLYREHLAHSTSHLDVGVGTGYYPMNSLDLLRGDTKTVLMDITPHTLTMVSNRLKNDAGLQQVEAIMHDATKPWDRPAHLPKFDSISVFYVFHCMAGSSITEKVDAVCGSLKYHLEPVKGVFYGATILGVEANHNVLGRLLMSLYNRKGIFGNVNDKESDLRDALKVHFQEVDVVREGKVALFTAKRPILEQQSD
ncbi:Putative uncharacterized protein YbcY [Cytospora mali]|uniref:Methyltransferase type 12 domain-containing protein n=1 Tax=Cytospora mali TaxID=578113 RepID=A0A194VUG8_CYTMA|nr:Putative uncharacterized protein YbcY [Valsa mali]